MLHQRLMSIICATALVFGLAMTADQAAAQEKAAAVAAPQAKPTIAKICTNCHQAEPGNLRGNFDGVAYQNESIQIKIDDTTEILRFDSKTVKVRNVQPDPNNPSEPLRVIKKGKEVRVEYTEKDGKKFATSVFAKPPIKVKAEMLMTTADVEKLVAQGPEKGKYLLIDARPAPRFLEGAIPTAINIPFVAFDKMVDKLPKDKSALIVYYCAGMTWAMSPNSAGRAEKLGYTNVKVYHEGLPEWTKKNYTVLSAQSLKEVYIDKEIPNVLLDVRPAAEAKKGFIKGAVTLPAADVAANIAKFPPKDKKPPIIVVDDKGGGDATNSAKTLIAAGYTSVTILTGGMDAWQAAKYPVETGNLATSITYVPKPRPGEIAIEDFKKIAASTSPDTLIIDVRSREEANFGVIKGAKVIPDMEILDRLAEIPKDRRIITYCNTGVQAEMTYHKLKEKGYNVKFLNANVNFDDKGNYTIEKL